MPLAADRSIEQRVAHPVLRRAAAAQARTAQVHGSCTVPAAAAAGGARASAGDRSRPAPASASEHAAMRAARTSVVRRARHACVRASVTVSAPARNIRERPGRMIDGSLHAFNFQHWIDANRALLKPPVGNKRVFQDGDFVIMVVGGPNARKDYHVDPGAGVLLPARGRHGAEDHAGRAPGRCADPRRRGAPAPAATCRTPRSAPPNTVGLVVERPAPPGELDGFQWYCERCGHLLYEEFFPLTDIETQFPPVFERFFDNVQQRTCGRCGTVMEPQREVHARMRSCSAAARRRSRAVRPARSRPAARFRRRAAAPLRRPARLVRAARGRRTSAAP